MLGTSIADPDGIEGPPASADALGWLDMTTVLTGEKTLTEVVGIECGSGLPIKGYEMHIGKTGGAALDRPFLDLDHRKEGAISGDGRIMGCYLHGLFANDRFRHHFLNRIRRRSTSGVNYEQQVEATLDALASHLERHLDIQALIRIAHRRPA
jgi:adenosylcobyric acid synthase